MNKLPVLADFNYDRIGSFRNGNPYTIAYCYTSNQYHRHAAFIIKGGCKDVEYYIERLGFPMLVWKTYWWHGFPRASTPSFENFKKWSVSGKCPYVFPEQMRRDRKTSRFFYRNWYISFLGRRCLQFRRLPRKWLPEYDEMLSQPSINNGRQS